MGIYTLERMSLRSALRSELGYGVERNEILYIPRRTMLPGDLASRGLFHSFHLRQPLDTPAYMRPYQAHE